jgi:glutaredoxin
MLKDYLTSKNIPYAEKLVDMNENDQKEMSSVSGGFLGVPFTTIINDASQTQTVLGFDKGKLDSILHLQ